MPQRPSDPGEDSILTPTSTVKYAMMAEIAPIEVWQMILKYAIAVPLFLDPDPTTNYGVEYLSRWRFEAPYWEAERNRNTFRRVCRSWDTFLQQYAHRYARLSDIYNGRIPMTVAPMAIRLNIQPEIRGEDGIQGTFSGMSGLLRALINPPGPYITTATVERWRTEIIEGYTIMDTKLYASFVEKAPGLQAIVDHRRSFYVKETAPHKVDGLRLLYANTSWANNVREHFIFPHLTTLYLIHLSINASLSSMCLPCLRHLSIEGFSLTNGSGMGGINGARGIGVSGEAFNNKMVEILPWLGKNLITLHYQVFITISPVSVADIWLLIPHVKRIQLPYWEGALLPTDHPARIVTLSMQSLVGFMTEEMKKSENPLFNYIPDLTQFPAHGLATRMEITWFTALMIRPHMRPTTPRVGISTWLAEYYDEKGVKFTDSEGLALNGYLVFLIRAFWKRDRVSPVTESGATVEMRGPWSVVVVRGLWAG